MEGGGWRMEGGLALGVIGSSSEIGDQSGSDKIRKLGGGGY